MTKKEFVDAHMDTIQDLYHQYDLESLGILERLKKSVDAIIEELVTGKLMDCSDFFNPVPTSNPDFAMEEIKNKVAREATEAFYSKMDRKTAISILNGAVLLKRSPGMLFTEVRIPVVGGEEESIMGFVAHWNSSHRAEEPIKYDAPEDAIWW